MSLEKFDEKATREYERKKENARKYYWEKVNSHRCTLCGEKLEEGYPYRKCRPCLDFNWNKRKSDQEGKPKDNYHQIKYYKNNREKVLAKTKEQRLYRIENKLCVHCGKKLGPTAKFQKCFECRKKQNTYRRKKREEQKNEGH